MMPKAYISGPISGLDVDLVKQSFRKAKFVAESFGYEAVSPVDGVTDWDGCWIDYMIRDLQLLRDCAAIVIMRRKESPGMAIERIAAQRMGLTVIHIDV